MFVELLKVCTFAPGELAEWSNAAVLKTVVCHRTGGSNPSLSARNKQPLFSNDKGFFNACKSIVSSSRSKLHRNQKQ